MSVMKKYVKKMGKAALCAFTVASLAFAASCETAGQVGQALIDTAAQTGVISQDTANTLGKATDAAVAVASSMQDITPEEEYYIGRAVGANILANYKVYANQALTDYVNQILDTIVISSPRPEIFKGYHAAVLDTTEINGFSTSGGHVFLTRGLVECAPSEDALAAVIAHELAHIQLQHSVKSIKNSRFTGALQQVAGVAATAMGYEELTQVFEESINEAVQTVISNGYSKEQEYEADAYAMSILASAGYTPSSIVGMLESINNRAGGSSYPSLSGALKSTHPTPDARLTEVRKNLAAYQGLPDNTPVRQPRFNAIKK